MYESAFKQILAKNELANAYLIYGACETSLEILRRKICSIWAPNLILKMSEMDFDFARARDFLQTNDLFYLNKLLLLELYKDELKSFKLSQLKKLAGCDSRLLIIAHSAKAQKSAEKDFGNDFVRVFEKEQAHEQVTLLQDFAQVLNIQTAKADLAKLASAYASDLSIAISELRKFENGVLDLSMCDFADIESEQFDELFLAIFTSDLNLNLFKDSLLASDEIALLNKLGASFLRLFKLAAFAKANGVMDFSVALGYNPPPKVRNKMQQLAMICDEKFADILEILLLAQNEIITQAAEPQTTILESVLKINQILTKKR